MGRRADGKVWICNTCFFILPGITDIPFVYHVKTVRDGGSYCTRSVSVVQAEGKGIAFTATVSFKRAESTLVEVWNGRDLYGHYATALRGRRPEDFPETPGMDTPWYREVLKKEHRVDQFPGLSCREVDMRAWNQGKPPLEKRQLYFYTPLGDVPPVSESPNFHAIAHLYASDRNSLYLIPNILEKGNDYTLMASLSINVVFNGVMKDTDVGRNALGRDRWFCQEAEVSWIGGGRGIHQSRIWSPEGNLVATTWQEGLVRFGKGEEYRKVEGKTSRL
ncbi:MAG: hypothetical protein Q9157_001879 [Trypethelium eluteriae]